MFVHRVSAYTFQHTRALFRSVVSQLWQMETFTIQLEQSFVASTTYLMKHIDWLWLLVLVIFKRISYSF